MIHDPDTRSEAKDRVLEVACRRTLRGAGELTTDLTVACPSRGHDISLEVCVECAKFRGFRLGPDSDEVALACGSDEIGGNEPRPAFSVEAHEHGSISEIMTRNVVCVGPELEVDAVADLLLKRGISGAPVVDDDGRPLGVISKTDLLREYHDRPHPVGGATAARLTVRDIMMPLVFCLPANESIARAAALMAFEHVHRLPVIGVTGEIVGMISSLDVVRWHAARQGYVVGGRSK